MGTRSVTRTPTAAAFVPSEAEFVGDYIPAPGIQKIADELISSKAGLGFLQGYRIAYFWKAKATKKAGRLIAGKASKPSGLLRLTSGAEFIIEIAADAMRGQNQITLEATIYHELCHLGEEETEDGATRAVLIPHDLEMFHAEVDEYGLWRLDLTNGERTFRQLTLADTVAA